MQVTGDSNLKIPDTLEQQLLAFRRRVWCLKIFEAIAGAAIGLLLGFLLTYSLDRLVDTPRIVRGCILICSLVACGMVPVAIDRWIYRRRRLDQLARLLAQTHPSAGDQLLGVIELSEDASEQSRSPTLVQAAIDQVASNVARQSLASAIPNPRHKQRALVAGMLGLLACGLFVVTAAAAGNAWTRFVAPWKSTPRYTFASIKDLPPQLVVPHGEAFQFSIGLKESSRWSPTTGRVSLPGQAAKIAELNDLRYEFEFPGQFEASELDVRIGDFKSEVPVEPKLRPELHSLRAEIILPDYLGRSLPLSKEIRGASLSAVKGSETILTAIASRKLTSATVNGEVRFPNSEKFSTERIAVDKISEVELQWQDEFGLRGRQPFALAIEATDDAAPTLVCDDLPRRKVLLNSEVLKFAVRARDDFGVRRVGIQWQGLDPTAKKVASGETILGAGSQETELLDLAGAFCPADQKITPQPIAVQVFVEDYLPGRERIYTPTSIFEVLDAEQHAIWITTQLTRWHRMSLEVRDRELQLHETNRQLRGLPEEQLATVENRERLSQQADLERTNGQRLKSLVANGEGLLKEAMRNPDLGVGHLDKWAEMMQLLKDISSNRMPSVADLLKEASELTGKNSEPGSNSDGKQVGENRLTQSGEGQAKQMDEPAKPNPPSPSISDIESSQLDLKSAGPEADDPSKPKQSRLTLAETKLAGNAKSDAQAAAAEGKVADAVKEQSDLLAEFDKIADELNDVLANLEGSTLVKRLKASSRKQQKVASKLLALVSNSFGVSDREKELHREIFEDLAKTEVDSSQEASHIMDDMAAYFERSRFMLFQRVLDDMREQDVTAELRQLGEEIRKENGLSISQAEYWSDTFDRWAEDLVEVTKGGASPGAKAKGSLPPSIVLEVLQLLEGEVNLREQTRVAEQARPAVTDTEHMVSASQLSENQNGFHERMTKVVNRILELPDAEADFAKELNLLSEVSEVMAETTEILAQPETGPPAIAAETEIIELLLKSKRFNPNAGGGGGADPGGGGSGDTETPALALVGVGANDNEVREAMSATQATGGSSVGLPEEFRSGLDEYFDRLESWKAE